MNTTAPTPSDPDLAEQALPGHGVPSQDPDPTAQLPRDPAEVQREVQTVILGGGAAAGVATGAAIGAVGWQGPLAWRLAPQWGPSPAHSVAPPQLPL